MPQSEKEVAQKVFSHFLLRNGSPKLLVETLLLFDLISQRLHSCPCLGAKKFCYAC